MALRVITTLPGARSSPEDSRWVLAVPQKHIAAEGGGSPKSAVQDLTTKIARAARYDGPSLSICPSDSSLPRMNVRNGSHALHLDLHVVVVIRTIESSYF